MSKLQALIGAAALTFCMQSQAGVINFNNIANTTSFNQNRATISGFTFSSTLDNFLFSTGSNAWMDIATTAYNSTDYLVSLGTLTIRNAGASAFNVSSLDLIGWNSLQSGATITGFRADGSRVSLNVDFRDTPNFMYVRGDDFKKVLLSGFTNLTSLTISGRGVGALALDNVNASAVPEPGTLSILALGLGALAFGRRRKQA